LKIQIKGKIGAVTKSNDPQADGRARPPEKWGLHYQRLSDRGRAFAETDAPAESVRNERGLGAPSTIAVARYTIRARIEREQWSVAIHPAGVEMKGEVVSGPREKAELQARAMINTWLKSHSTQKLKSD
jgi:hypothetical protein